MIEITMTPFDPKAGNAWRRITNTLTNWERNQWARKGYPGLKRHDAAIVAKMFPAAVRRITGYVTTFDRPDDVMPRAALSNAQE